MSPTNAVELRGRDPLGAPIGELDRPLEQLRDPAPGLRRAGDHRRALADPLRQPRLRVLEIDVARRPVSMSHLLSATSVAQPVSHRQLGDPQVLGRDPLGGVADDDRDVGALGGALGAKLGVVVDRAGDLGPAPDPGGVDQDQRPAVDLERVSIASRVVPASSETITRSAPRKRVDQRRLADVRPADDRDARLVRLLRFASGRDGRLAGAQLGRSGRAGPRCRARGWPRPAIGSPRPRRAARRSGSSAAASTLFATTTTGSSARRRIVGDLGVALAQPGAGVDARARPRRRRRSPPAPAPGPRARASRRRRGRRRRCRSARSGRPFHSHSSALRSRVTPACCGRRPRARRRAG